MARSAATERYLSSYPLLRSRVALPRSTQSRPFWCIRMVCDAQRPSSTKAPRLFRRSAGTVVHPLRHYTTGISAAAAPAKTAPVGTPSGGGSGEDHPSSTSTNTDVKQARTQRARARRQSGRTILPTEGRMASAIAIEGEDPDEAQERKDEEEIRRLMQFRLERAMKKDTERVEGSGTSEVLRATKDQGESERERRKCLAFCTADSYVLPKLYRMLRVDELISAEWRISYIRRDRKYIRLQCFDGSEVFIFPFGSFVCWDVDEVDFIHLRQLIRQAERGERTEIYEEFDYVHGNDTAVDVEEDDLVIKEDDPITKWPVSFALAQSIKLEYFEQEVKGTFQEMQTLAHALAHKGHIPLTPRNIVQEMGKIMELLINVNLGETDFVSDIPDDFWEDTESANTWKIFNSYLGVKNRAKVIDSQLKMFNEFYAMLSSEVHVRKSTRLEWAIIFLISIEVVFGVADHSEWITSLF